MASFMERPRSILGTLNPSSYISALPPFPPPHLSYFPLPLHSNSTPAPPTHTTSSPILEIAENTLFYFLSLFLSPFFAFFIYPFSLSFPSSFHLSFFPFLSFFLPAFVMYTRPSRSVFHRISRVVFKTGIHPRKNKRQKQIKHKK